MTFRTRAEPSERREPSRTAADKYATAGCMLTLTRVRSEMSELRPAPHNERAGPAAAVTEAGSAQNTENVHRMYAHRFELCLAVVMALAWAATR